MSRLCILLALVGCADNRLVIQDNDMLPSEAIRAVAALETAAECTLWDSIVVGGEPYDWRGKLPRSCTTTIQYGGSLNEKHAGEYEHGKVRDNHRIYIKKLSKYEPTKTVTRSDIRVLIIIHELGHRFGLEHSKGVMQQELEHTLPLEDLMKMTMADQLDTLRGNCLSNE